MSVRNSREIKAGLLRKGFVSRESDHVFLWFYHNGKKTSLRTKVSPGNTDCGDALLGLMARQLGISRAEFTDLVDCPLSQDDFVKRVTTNGKLRF